jgi:hypothetical protein
MKTNNTTTTTRQPRTNLLVIVAGIVIALIGSLVVFKADAKGQNRAETFGETRRSFASPSSVVALPKLKELASVVGIFSL